MPASEQQQEFIAALLRDLSTDRLELPTLPEVALRAREVAEDERVSAREVARVISEDTALTARLVAVANSALLRGAQPVDSLEGAITRLGNRTVRALVTTLAMRQIFQATSDATDRRLRALWEHSTEVAAICRALAAQCTQLHPAEAMLAGLVHDLGALPLLARAEDTPALLDDEQALEVLLYEHHGAVGAAILRAWHFPPELVAVADGHEDHARAHGGSADYLDLVIVANLQSHAGSEHPLAAVDWSAVPAFAKLGLDTEVTVVSVEDVAEGREILNG